MKLKQLFLVFSMGISINILVYTQTVHNVTANPNFTFTPSQLTIKVGDAVKWTNTGGFHNVIADDNSFTSGPASTSAWVFQFTFNSPGTNPYYCVIHGAPSGVGMSGVITVDAVTDVKDENISVYKFNLEQNYPNPFNPSTKIRYSIPNVETHQATLVQLKIYDVLGNEVATLVNEEKTAGTYEVNFSAIDGFTSNGKTLQLSSGIYFYRLKFGSFSESRKMILMK